MLKRIVNIVFILSLLLLIYYFISDRILPRDVDASHFGFTIFNSTIPLLTDNIMDTSLFTNSHILPSIAASDNNVYIALKSYLEGTICGVVSCFSNINYDVSLFMSNNNGESFERSSFNFTNIHDIFPSISNIIDFSYPSIIASGNNVYLSWNDNRGGNGTTHFVKSIDSGITFEEPITISDNNPSSSTSPKIATSGNNVYVVWSERNVDNGTIFFAASNNNGTSFSIKKALANNTKINEDPIIATSGNNVYVVWSERNVDNGTIFFAASNNNGTSFSIKKIFNTYSTAPISIATSVNNVYVVWASNNLTNQQDIFYTNSSNSGITFEEPITISDNNPSSSTSPKIATSGNNVYVVWSDINVDNEDVFLKRSTDYGNTFGGNFSIINLSNNTGKSVNPKITVSGKYVNVVWEDNTGGSLDIYFNRSHDNGNNFFNFNPTNTYLNLSNNTESSSLPQLEIGYGNEEYKGSGVYIIWIDDSDELKFKAGQQIE
jgi:hypothetical protein